MCALNVSKKAETHPSSVTPPCHKKVYGSTHSCHVEQEENRQNHVGSIYDVQIMKLCPPQLGLPTHSYRNVCKLLEKRERK